MIWALIILVAISAVSCGLLVWHYLDQSAPFSRYGRWRIDVLPEGGGPIDVVVPWGYNSKPETHTFGWNAEESIWVEPIGGKSIECGSRPRKWRRSRSK